ncbi:MAG TPA: hypothetical protein VHB21_06360, partial [Minicystis sp.]|nr:hypothetical protein [Minicystis sp.]
MALLAGSAVPELDVADLESSSSTGDAILTTDASAEGEAYAAALRARGFHVVDVPLSLLEARAIGEAPRVILIDVDQPGAIEAVERVRELAAGSAAELVCIGDPARAAELGLEPTSVRVFERPVDRDRLVDLVSHLAEPMHRDGPLRATTPPPSYLPRRDTAAPPFRPSDAPSASEFPVGSEFPVASDPLDVDALVQPLEGGPAPLLAVPMSPELERLLRDAEARVAIDHPVAPASGAPANDEPDLLLPAELLSALDEPLDPDSDESGTGSGG